MKNCHLVNVGFLKGFLVLLVFAISPIFAQIPIWNTGALQHQEQGLVKQGSGLTALSAQVADFTQTDTLKQSFIIKSDDPRVRSILLQNLFLKTYLWAGSTGKIVYQIRKGPVDSVGAPILTAITLSSLKAVDGTSGLNTPNGSGSVPLVPQLFPESLSVVYTRTSNNIDSASNIYKNNGIPVLPNQTYSLYIIAQSLDPAYRSFGFYKSSTDYVDGALQSGGDLWFQMAGRVDSDIDTSLHFAQAANNQTYLDIYSSVFAQKLVALGKTEKLIVNGQNLGQYSFEVQDPTVMSLQLGGSNPLELNLTGLKKGKTKVYIKKNNAVVNQFYVQVSPRYYLDLSYTYIKHPSEDTTAINKSWNTGTETISLVNYEMRKQFDSVSAYMTRLYDSLNISLNIINNGIITYNWDLNGDKNSYDASYKEVWAPLDSNIIPNQFKVHTNLFVLRDQFPDIGKTSQNGGGSSMDAFDGLGKPKRGAHKRCHLQNTPFSIGSTLSHELAHNLSLGHYTKQNSMYYPTMGTDVNVMWVGRPIDEFAAFQWESIFNRMDERILAGEDYTPKVVKNLKNPLVHPNSSHSDYDLLGRPLQGKEGETMRFIFKLH